MLHRIVLVFTRLIVDWAIGSLIQSNLRHNLLHTLPVYLTRIVLEYDVHLLERLEASLRHEEEYPQEHEQAEAGEEDVGAELQLIQHVGRDLANREVHHVVAADDDTNCLAPMAWREDFGAKEPGHWSP